MTPAGGAFQGHNRPPQPSDAPMRLPNGDVFALTRSYSPTQTNGVLFLAVISCISATAVIALLFAITVFTFNTRKLPKSKSNWQVFIRSHVALYFLSLLLCDITQAVGSIMSIRWVEEHGVTYGPYCTVQGVVKHVADVGTAWWSTTIAVNTFWFLFLRWELKRTVLLVNLVGGWTAIAILVAVGPAAIQSRRSGPFYGISGYWCWIANGHPAERITLDYMIMFIAALLSFIMYMLVFLKLRGHILVHRWHISFHRHPNLVQSITRRPENSITAITKRMLLYPVAYTILLLPIAACRFAEWTGHDVPFGVTIFSDSIFLLSGLVNVVLFITTRRVLPIDNIVPHWARRLSVASFRGSHGHTFAIPPLVGGGRGAGPLSASDSTTSSPTRERRLEVLQIGSWDAEKMVHGSEHTLVRSESAGDDDDRDAVSSRHHRRDRESGLGEEEEELEAESPTSAKPFIVGHGFVDDDRAGGDARDAERAVGGMHGDVVLQPLRRPPETWHG